MPTGPLPPELPFLQIPVDGSATSLVALALLLAVVAWARSPGHRDRWLAVEAATYISLLVIGIPLLAVRMSWWQGAFFTSTPMVVLAAIYVPFSIAGCTLWLGPYRWLAGRTKHALVLYGVIVLAFFPSSCRWTRSRWNEGSSPRPAGTGDGRYSDQQAA
jgi:hypothetical protein